MLEILSPTIQEIVLRERLAIDGKGRPQTIFSIGVVLEDGRTFWGDCPFTRTSAEDIPHIILNSINPLLVGQTAQEWPTFLEQLESASYMPEESGDTDAATSPQPVPLALVLGGQIAVMKMAEAVLEIPIAKLWRIKQKRPALITTAESAGSDLVFGHVDAIVGNIALIPDEESRHARLGVNAELLQKYVRDLAGWLSAKLPEDQSGTIILHLNNNVDLLYDSRAGKILGTLIGLQNAIQPHDLILIDLLGGRPNEADADLARRYSGVRGMMRIRKVDFKLFDSDLSEVKDVAVNGLLYDLARTGGLHGLRTRLLNPMTADHLIVRLPRVCSDETLQFLLPLLGTVYKVWLPNGISAAVAAVNTLEAMA